MSDDPPEPSIAGAAFWALMDHWAVPDDVALRLIAGPERRPAGGRPRFRLRGAQAETYGLLRGIDRHLEDLFGTSRAWLSTGIREKPFARRTPLAYMAEGGPGAVGDVLRHLERLAFKASLERAAKPL
jgi:hypothetical protein